MMTRFNSAGNERVKDLVGPWEREAPNKAYLDLGYRNPDL